MENTVQNAGFATRSVGNLAKVTDMSLASSFKERVSAILAFVAPNQPNKAAFPRAAKFLGLGERRVRALFALEARTIKVADEDAIFEAEVRMSEHFIENEVPRHADRLELAALKLSAQCPRTHRGRIARLRDLARRVRGAPERVEA